MTRKICVFCLALALIAAGIKVTKANEVANIKAPTVSGAEEPSKIPFEVKYAHFFAGYQHMYRDRLVQGLRGNDDATITNAAINDQRWQEKEAERYNRELRNLCAQRGPRSPVALAEAYEQLAANSNGRRAAEYRKTLDQLSEAGRNEVEQFVDTQLVSGISMAVPNTVDLARTNPDIFMENFEIICHVANTGDMPSDVKQKMRDFAEKRGITEDGDENQ